MKSEHRHELETNTLARYLAKWIDSSKPYAQVAVLGALAVVVGFVLWTWFGSAAGGRDQQAWQAYNMSVEGFEPSLDMLKQAGESFPDSPPGELADLTWADGQVMQATNAYLVSKEVSKEALDGAAKKYDDLIDRSSDPIILSRAHLGLGRVFELRADAEKAQAEYKLVTGPFKPLAEASIKRLDSSQAPAALEWLATAEVSRVAMPTGPGTPGVRPEFQVDELTTPGTEPGVAPSFEDLLKRIGEGQPDGTDRYAPPGEQPLPGVTEGTPPADPQSPMEGQPPMEEQPPTEDVPPMAEPPAEPESTPPAEEPPAEAPPVEEPASEDDAPSPQS